MINGVEILSQEVVPIMNLNLRILVFGLIVSLILGFCVLIILDNDHLASLTLFFGTIVSLLVMFLNIKQTEEYTKYKVLISDDVNFVEFNEKYEVLSQDGKIYTSKKKY
jgi:hypothetical protein